MVGHTVIRWCERSSAAANGGALARSEQPEPVGSGHDAADGADPGSVVVRASKRATARSAAEPFRFIMGMR